MSRGKPPSQSPFLTEPVAGNGLLDRRVFLTQGFALLGAGGLGSVHSAGSCSRSSPHASLDAVPRSGDERLWGSGQVRE